ncbi:MAG: hypothetical protein V3U75_09545 [Methylococcaceae bacterium]
MGKKKTSMTSKIEEHLKGYQAREDESLRKAAERRKGYEIYHKVNLSDDRLALAAAEVNVAVSERWEMLTVGNGKTEDQVDKNYLKKIDLWEKSSNENDDLRSNHLSSSVPERSKAQEELLVSNEPMNFEEESDRIKEIKKEIKKESLQTGKGDVVELNKQNGSFYDEQYIKDKKPSDFDRLKSTGERLDNAKESVVSGYDEKQQARKVIQEVEERRNALEKTTEKAADLSKAKETLPKSEVIEKHPEMKPVYEREQFMRDFTKKHIKDKNQHEPMVKASVALDIKQISSGKQLPKVNEVVKAPAKEKEAELEH